MKRSLYSDIIVKTKELLDLSSHDPEFKSHRDKMKKQDKLIAELRDIARSHNTLLGRMVKFQHADSFALYIITKVNKTTVQLTWVDYCDGWMDGRVGAKGNVDKTWAERVIKFEDKWSDLAEKRRIETASAK